MAYGVEFYNQNGKLQLSDSVNNFYMVEKGTINSTNGSVFYTVTPTVAYDAIAVFCPTMAVLPKSMFSSVQAANTPQTFRKISTSNATIFWYAYRSYNSVTPATSGYGLEIYNATGQVAFSSNYPKILKGIKIPIPNEQATSTTVSAAKEFAFLQYGTSRGIVTVTEPMGGGEYDSPTDRFVYRFAASYTSIQSSQVRARAYATTEPIGFTGGLLAVDVTNY
jgi:hypothetical protein